jgi:hypothetical protein
MKRTSITLVIKFVALITDWSVSAQISRPENCRKKSFRDRFQGEISALILSPKRQSKIGAAQCGLRRLVGWQDCLQSTHAIEQLSI